MSHTRITIGFLILLLLQPCWPAHGQTNTLRVLLTAAESSLDPAVGSDLSSLSIIENIFDPPLRYDYLARPIALQANTALALPHVSADGKTWTLKLKPSIWFSPDPAFAGRRRELQASDYIYSWKRLYDPALKSPWRFLLAGKLEGDAVLLEAARRGQFDIQQALPGLQALDKYTLQIRLQQADPNFIYFLAMPAASAVAHEIVQQAGVQTPRVVGSGPYHITEWQRGHKLVLQTNPHYRQDIFLSTTNLLPPQQKTPISKPQPQQKTPISQQNQYLTKDTHNSANIQLKNIQLKTPIQRSAQDSAKDTHHPAKDTHDSAKDTHDIQSIQYKTSIQQKLANQLQGKTLPRTPRIDIYVIEEGQAQVLAFLSGQFDFLEQVPPSLVEMVMQANTLRPELVQRGITLSRFTPLQTYYMWMNMQDPVIGGYSLPKLALRRAIALAYNRNEDIRLLEKGWALPAQSPLPPDVLGFDPYYRSPIPHDLALARKLLDEFGYHRRDAQGFRLQANGQALHLLMHSVNTAEGRARDEVWRKTLGALEIRISFKAEKKSEINKAARKGMVQMFETNWLGDWPDGGNFLQLLYGPNSGGANYAHFQLPAYDRLYEQAAKLPHGPQRQALYHEMFQLIHAYNPWILRIHPQSLDLQQPRLRNYLRHPVMLTNWRYLEVR